MHRGGAYTDRLIKRVSQKESNEIYEYKRTAMLGVIACVSLLLALVLSINYGMMTKNRVSALETKLIKCQKELTISKKKVIYSRKEVSHFMAMALNNRSFRVKISGYHPDTGGINSDSNPNMTATMTPHKAGRTCAISTELVEAGWLGKEIYVEGFGMVIANDRLSKTIKGKQIDLCKGTLKQALAVGVNENVLSAVVSRKDINKITEN